MKAVPRGAVRGLAAFGCIVLLSGCGLEQPVPPSASPEPSAGVSTPVTPSSAPATSADPSSTPSATPTPAPSTSAPLRQLTPPATPAVTGDAVFGTKLGISQGAWRPAPVALAFQWLRDGEPIATATSSTYQLTGDDITHRIAVIVTGSKDGYADSSLRSSQVGPVAPAKLKPATPTVSGTVKVGHTLTGKVAPWGPGTVTLAWQWYRDSGPIVDATATTYKLAVADYGHKVTVQVTGTRSNHKTTARDSVPTGKVGPGTLKPAPIPSLSGTARVGEKLTSDAGEWGPGAVVLAYQWFRNSGKTDMAIKGATAAVHTVTPADLDARLRVRVTASRKGYTTVSRFSDYSGAVVKGHLTAPTPLVTGLTILGNTLAADPGE